MITGDIGLFGFPGPQGEKYQASCYYIIRFLLLTFSREIESNLLNFQSKFFRTKMVYANNCLIISTSQY